MPDRQNIVVGDNLASGISLPEVVFHNVTMSLCAADLHAQDLHSNSQVFSLDSSIPLANKPGQLEMRLNLFGLLPIHRMTVNVVEPLKLIPGGQSIGVLLNAEGLMVVGEAAVEKDGQAFFPARSAGIEVGDLILKINGSKISSENHLQEIIDQCGKDGEEITLLIKHNNKKEETKLTPVLCDKTGRYRIGVFVKNSTAGVGTLTFIEPESKTYGALGHLIADFESGQKLNATEGKIVEAFIKGLHPGKNGAPGEKIGVFKGSSEINGNIEKNSDCGIFGILQKNIQDPYYKHPIPVAMRYSVQKGPAQILTVLEGTRVEAYEIDIINILPAGSNKDLVIKVTDQALIERTGGIIQGMSGSPIIQNGKLAGAVTHVFINDPTKGYGVLIENMLDEVNLLKTQNTAKEAG